MNDILCAIIIICITIFFIWLWWFINVKRPEDKRMKEEKSRITNYDKYKNEIRNFK